MKKLYAVTLLMLIVGFYACQKDVDTIMNNNGQAELAASLDACGTPFDTTLINFGGLLSGSIEVMNDDTAYHIILRESYADYKISRI